MGRHRVLPSRIEDRIHNLAAVEDPACVGYSGIGAVDIDAEDEETCEQEDSLIGQLIQ